MSQGPTVARPNNPAPIRVLIVEDHQLFAEALARALEDEPDMVTVGICRFLDSAREFLRNDRVDVVLMDYHMPDGDGIAAARYVREEHPRTRVVVVSAAEDRAVLFEALDAGCSGFIGKSESMIHLAAAIRGAMVGNVALSPGMAAKLLGPDGRSHGYGFALTPRELEVLRAMAQGLSNLQIADRLFMSETTLRNKIARINSKLGVHSKLEAVTRGLRLGLVELDPEDDREDARVLVVRTPPA
ncbi:MAG: response regulator transcription factor [Candidatus Dormiibacterota bacterium]